MNCPETVIEQRITDDGAAWILQSNGTLNCLWRSNDQDERSLIREWEGAAPLQVEAGETGLVLVGAGRIWIYEEDRTQSWYARWEGPVCVRQEGEVWTISPPEGRWVVEGERVERLPWGSCG